MKPNEFQRFTQSLKTAIELFLDEAQEKQEFKQIYRKGMYAYNVLNAWSPNSRELLEAAAGATRRSIALFSIRQYSLVYVELRRFIECIIWLSYFIDHPVEWEMFKGNPFRSWRDSPRKPIETAANAPINFYLRYLSERLSSEPSGLAKQAVDVFRNEYSLLSTYIHGARPAMEGTLTQMYDREDHSQNKRMSSSCYKIFKSGCIILAALNITWLNNLNLRDRNYFDTLVSPSTARKIRGQSFGIQ